MKKILYGIIAMFLLLSCNAQQTEYAQIYGHVVDNLRLQSLKIYETVNGKCVEIGTTKVSPDGFFGFMVQVKEEGIYTIGNFPLDLYSVYLKPGDKTKININRDSMVLVETNSAEMQVMYDWYALSYKADMIGVRFDKKMSSYEDFFPEFEKLLTQTENFKQKINTGNVSFDEFMKKKIDFDKDQMALSLLFTPRTKHPQRKDYPAYYSTILNKDKLKGTEILKLPYGLRLMDMYSMFHFSETGKQDNMKEGIEAITDNKQLKGEMVLAKASMYKFHEDYLRMMEDYGKYFVTDDQKMRAEAIGSKLYDPTTSNVAANFTYPDVNGKQVSLSDFKGKVVLVDVWATWCAPCRAEIPHLKKLEKEMHGKEIVFIGVSLDVEKDKKKWQEMVKKEGLEGIQLFANGFESKIAADYKITGIPRFMVFGKDGKIVALNAPRPSMPDLKKMLEAELKK